MSKVKNCNLRPNLGASKSPETQLSFIHSSGQIHSFMLITNLCSGCIHPASFFHFNYSIILCSERGTWDPGSCLAGTEGPGEETMVHLPSPESSPSLQLLQQTSFYLEPPTQWTPGLKAKLARVCRVGSSPASSVPWPNVRLLRSSPGDKIAYRLVSQRMPACFSRYL